MTTTITVDRAGRVLIPKSLRQKLRLGPGDELQLNSEGDKITLQPVRARALLKKEHGVWVYQGEPSNTSIPDLIDRMREDRMADVLPGVVRTESHVTDLVESLNSDLAKRKKPARNLTAVAKSRTREHRGTR